MDILAFSITNNRMSYNCAFSLVWTLAPIVYKP
nr:MAG TPA: hypothetical protein [Caudoviricetes sp.]